MSEPYRDGLGKTIVGDIQTHVKKRSTPFGSEKGRRRGAEVTHYARAVAATPVGVVGYGNWGRKIVRDLVELGAAVTVVARTETKSREALDAGVVRVVSHTTTFPTTSKAVVADTDRDSRGGDQGAADLPRVPIYVEKPLTDDPRAAGGSRAAPDRLFVMHKWRYHPGIALLAEIARSGELGPVVGSPHHARRLGQPARRCRRRLDARPARPLDRARDPRVRSLSLEPPSPSVGGK